MTTPGSGSGATWGGDGITWGELVGTWNDLMQQNGTWDDVRHGRGRAGVALAAGGALTATATVTSPLLTSAAPVTREQADVVIGQLGQVLTEMRRANPRWWATPTAMAIYTLINLLIAVGALYVAARPAPDDHGAGGAPAATSSAVSGPAATCIAPAPPPDPAPAEPAQRVLDR
ncbi:hypothetical protein WIS52_20330 [Pseudonocardia nematodicida]|uniref:Uncharacterized protein n=1 Tax=Pseudonocardia nematodicida TaxID=1206997 RepID=A0ABV1KEC7_9PSEU